MAAAGCYLVPTLSAMRDTLRWAEEGALTPTQCKKILDFNLDIGHCVQVAKEYGVKLASGTDYISRAQHGKNLEEVLLMHRAGLTVEEALLAATAGGAELCGLDGELGRLAEGFIFDAIVLDADPGDLSCFAEPGAVSGVFQRGVPVRSASSLRRAGSGFMSVVASDRAARRVSRRLEAIRRGAGPHRHRSRDRPELDSRARGGERRGQVDARQGARRRPPARRRRTVGRGTHASTTAPPATRWPMESRSSRRSRRSSRTVPCSRTSSSGSRTSTVGIVDRRALSRRYNALVERDRHRASCATTRANAPRRRPAEGRDPQSDCARGEVHRHGRADVGADPRRGGAALRARPASSRRAGRRSST